MHLPVVWGARLGDMQTIERAFVAGAGLMGHGIAQVLATIGIAVALYEPDRARAQAGRERIAGNLARSVAKGRLDERDRDATLKRVLPTADLSAVDGADIVVEAVFEDVDVKTRLWADLDGGAADRTISVSAARRARFVGMHFFSPVPVMPLVELIRGSATDDATEAAVRALAERMGKQVIASADRPGFIVNRILMPLLAEAMRAYQEGLGTAEDIDTGARVGLNHPMGPLELADFIGLDVVLGVMRVLHEGLGQEQFRPPRILEGLVAAGHLGEKSGQGFHRYPG